MENPRLVTLLTLNKTELVPSVTCYKLKVVSGTKKAEMRRALTKCLVDKENVLKEKEESLPNLELRKLVFQE